MIAISDGISLGGSGRNLIGAVIGLSVDDHVTVLWLRCAGHEFWSECGEHTIVTYSKRDVEPWLDNGAWDRL